ncbi:hypothetical protein ELUMI_v1c04990 [Williamsoniiplasma luminosum]|uniref:Uncharacterized protein n=1 Tax=Williamsoniiplasma luminosum TaxID=214888 RepID=A0A2K8NX63_9MOLU|nr:hypothetical protein [Williamsoniiplasma luminosum]ATZ17223.1 hypothetical protein ELUMI_v1c04990 [Williamsoniiplasma luminosum]
MNKINKFLLNTEARLQDLKVYLEDNQSKIREINENNQKILAEIDDLEQTKKLLEGVVEKEGKVDERKPETIKSFLLKNEKQIQNWKIQFKCNQDRIRNINERIQNVLVEIDDLEQTKKLLEEIVDTADDGMEME